MSVFSYRYTKGGADKFWRIERGFLHNVVEFGRIGTKGQRVRKDHDSHAEAVAAATRLIAEKVRKGYRAVKYGDTAFAPKAARVKTSLPLPSGVWARLSKPVLAPHARKIQELSLPSVRLVPRRRSDERIPIGASKLGGRPDLPPGVAWPTLVVRAPAPSARMAKRLGGGTYPTLPPSAGEAPLSFVAQIRLADAAKRDRQGLLPKRGMLYVFHCEQVFQSDGRRSPEHWEPLSGWAASDGLRYKTYVPGATRTRVIHFDGDLGMLARMEPPEANGGLGREHRSFSVRFQAELTLPHLETTWADHGEAGDDGPAIGFSGEAWDAYEKVTRSLRRGGAAVSQMLGHPDQAQPLALEARWSEVRKELFPEVKGGVPYVSKFHRGSRLLLQLGDDADHPYPLYVGIRIEDLRRKNFSRVWACTQR
jgi:predicted DNA-binding WGR domain protein